MDEPALRVWLESLRRQLGRKVSLGLVFMSPHHFRQAAQILEMIRVHAQVPLLAGCSSNSLIAGGEEIENGAGLVVGLYHLPGAELTAVHLTQATLDTAEGPGAWHGATGITPAQVNGWLAFADPFRLDCEEWLGAFNSAYPGVPVLGGLASGAPAERGTQVYLNGDVFEEGVVTIAVGGDVELRCVISQGCKPIGQPWTITRAEQNLIRQIGNRPAYAVLEETFNQLSPDEQRQSRGNLFVGLVMNEYQFEFHRGDFLVRNLLGVDPESGVVAVGAFPRTGQTMQFQRRDAATGTEDLEQLLQRAAAAGPSDRVLGGVLCSCNGRGAHLFGRGSHDAAHVQAALGPLGLAGFFCNGEIGPVGGKNYLHGYTAALALFVQRPATS